MMLDPVLARMMVPVRRMPDPPVLVVRMPDPLVLLMRMPDPSSRTLDPLLMRMLDPLVMRMPDPLTLPPRVAGPRPDGAGP